MSDRLAIGFNNRLYQGTLALSLETFEWLTGIHLVYARLQS